MQSVISGQYCERHGIEKTAWGKDSRRSGGGRWLCRECQREYGRIHDSRRRLRPERIQYNKEHGKRYYESRGRGPYREATWRHYGVDMTWERWEQIATHCRICGTTEKLVADHDHTTKQFRGVLCHACNLALGQFGDDPARIRCAELY